MLVGYQWVMVGFGTVTDLELAFEVIIVRPADVGISLDGLHFLAFLKAMELHGRQHCIRLVKFSSNTGTNLSTNIII